LVGKQLLGRWWSNEAKAVGFKSPGTYPYYDEDNKPFGESLKTSLREMIRVNRNHPSIITWSMCNEPFFTHQSTMPKVRELLKNW
jgi:beta-galactosidase/beta-glucuronidase